MPAILSGMSTQKHNHEPERLAWNALELAKQLGISERHLWAMLAEGRLGPQPLAFGRAKRWNIVEVQAWLAAGAPPREAWQARPVSVAG